MSFRQSTSIKLGCVGLVLGAFSGFIIRDEYYFPSYKRIDELVHEYYANEEKINSEIEELTTKMKRLATQGKSVSQEPKAASQKQQ